MNAYIVAGYRSPVGKAGRGGFRFTRTDDLAAEVIRHLMKSVSNVNKEQIDDVIVGNAMPEARAVAQRTTGDNNSDTIGALVEELFLG